MRRVFVVLLLSLWCLHTAFSDFSCNPGFYKKYVFSFNSTTSIGDLHMNQQQGLSLAASEIKIFGDTIYKLDNAGYNTTILTALDKSTRGIKWQSTVVADINRDDEGNYPSFFMPFSMLGQYLITNDTGGVYFSIAVHSARSITITPAVGAAVNIPFTDFHINMIVQFDVDGALLLERHYSAAKEANTGFSRYAKPAPWVIALAGNGDLFVAGRLIATYNFLFGTLSVYSPQVGAFISRIDWLVTGSALWSKPITSTKPETAYSYVYKTAILPKSISYDPVDNAIVGSFIFENDDILFDARPFKASSALFFEIVYKIFADNGYLMNTPMTIATRKEPVPFSWYKFYDTRRVVFDKSTPASYFVYGTYEKVMTAPVKLRAVGFTDIFLIKINVTGIEWSKSFGGPSIDISGDITTDPSGFVYISGSFKNTIQIDTKTLNSGTKQYSGFVAKFGPNGDLVFASQTVPSANFVDANGNLEERIALGLDVDPQDTLYVAGLVEFAPSLIAFAPTCTGCPKGTFGNSSDAYTVLQCDFCPQGTYSAIAGSTYCLECPTGTGPAGATSKDECRICPASSYPVPVQIQRQIVNTAVPVAAYMYYSSGYYMSYSPTANKVLMPQKILVDEAGSRYISGTYGYSLMGFGKTIQSMDYYSLRGYIGRLSASGDNFDWLLEIGLPYPTDKYSIVSSLIYNEAEDQIIFAGAFLHDITMGGTLYNSPFYSSYIATVSTNGTFISFNPSYLSSGVHEYPTALLQDKKNPGVVLFGTAGLNCFIRKHDYSNNREWYVYLVVPYDSLEPCTIISATNDEDSNIYLTVFFAAQQIELFSTNVTSTPALMTNPQYSNFMLLKYSHEGNLLWAIFPGEVDSVLTQAVVTYDKTSSTLVVVGSASIFYKCGEELLIPDGEDILTARYSKQGTCITAAVHGSSSTESANGVIVDNEGSLYVTASVPTSFEYSAVSRYVNEYDANPTMAVMKFTSQFGISWMFKNPSRFYEYGDIQAFSIALGASQEILVQSTHVSPDDRWSGQISSFWFLSENCNDCPVGTYSASPNSVASIHECTKCPAGTYSNLPRQTSASACVPCSNGTYSGNPGSGYCELCPVATYNEKTGSSSANDCKPCPPGQYTSTQGSDKCQVCGAGTYSIETRDYCARCPPGTFSSAVGASSFETCQDCKAGTYNPSDGASSCMSCSPGSYTMGTGATTCYNCSAGSYSTTAGGPESCKYCSAGSYNPEEGQTACISCPPGSYTMGTGSTACYNCSAGSYSTTAGGPESCKYCNLGYYNPEEGQTSCMKCPAGTFTFDTGSTYCYNCTAGTYSAVAGGLESCKQCAPGTFSDIDGSTSCTPCPAGTYTSMSGSTFCYKCPAGYYSTKTGGTSFDSCIPCKMGTYSTEDGSTQCTECGMGTYSKSLGASSESACLSCPLGTYNDDTGVSTCKQCAAGTYSPNEGALACIDCPSGTSNPSSGAKAYASCVECPAGTYAMQPASVSCTKCNMGTYSAIVGSYSMSCLDCEPGSYADGPGRSSCTKCPISTYLSEMGGYYAGMCTPCPDGTVTKLPGASHKDFCVPCPEGYYKDVDKCIACPAGTYSAVQGSMQCEQCPAGTYSPGGLSTCLSCAAGFFSGSGSISCAPCAGGTYTSYVNSSGCMSCDPNSICTTASVLPIYRPNYIEGIVAFDPFFEKQKDSSVNASLVTGLVVAGFAVIIIVVLVFMCIICLIARKSKWFYNRLSPVMTLDSFSLKHYTRAFDPVRKKPTPFGCCMTVIYLFMVLLVFTVLLLDIIFSNMVETSQVIPLQIWNTMALKQFKTTDIQGNYEITVKFSGFAGSRCDSSAPLIVAEGFQPVVTPNSAVQTASYNPEKLTCEIHYACSECILVGDTQTLSISFNDEWALASMVENKFSFPHFSGYFVEITETTIPDSEDQVFKGPTPTLFSVTLTKSIYVQVTLDAFIYSVFSSIRGETSPTTVGYSAIKQRATQGSMATGSDILSKKGLHAKYEFKLNPNAYYVQQSLKAKLFDFLAKVAAMSGAVTGVMVLIMARFESLFGNKAIFAGFFELKNPKPRQTDNEDEYAKAIELKVQPKEMVEEPAITADHKEEVVPVQNIESVQEPLPAPNEARP